MAEHMQSTRQDQTIPESIPTSSGQNASIHSKGQDDRLIQAVPVEIDCPSDSDCQPISFGIPFPRQVMSQPEQWWLTDSTGQVIPAQTRPLALWSDGSIRWLLIDTVAKSLSAGRHAWRFGRVETRDKVTSCEIQSASDPNHITIETGTAIFRLERRAVEPLLRATLTGQGGQAAVTGRLRMADSRGKSQKFQIRHTDIEHSGSVCTTVRVEGAFLGRAPCRIVIRLSFYAGTGLIRVDLTVHNPRRARHRGNLWDLGDPGSIFFRDVSLDIEVENTKDFRIGWTPEIGHPYREQPLSHFEIYQGSSGGTNWQSRNHVNRHGVIPLTLPGYRLRIDGSELVGKRATPTVRLATSKIAITACVPNFWEEFPKALSAEGNKLSIGLFPEQHSDGFELQGGEQKTHTVWLNVGHPGTNTDVLNWVHAPALAIISGQWLSKCSDFSRIHIHKSDPNDPFEKYLAPLLEGPRNFYHRREVIDEFGWRNFGDIHADHEEAYCDSPKPVVSHYNNQFDSIFGAILQHIRTGDRRWRDFSDPLARHVADIDIYHSDQDRSAYCGGSFWFTDHYKDAFTSTHRTFSQANKRHGQSYGGGPGNEHNFTTGLLYHHFLTGNPQSRDAVLSLANWVINRDDGRLNILGWVDNGPTGLVSFTTDPSYHGPGRGCGLSINALVDAWILTGQRLYIDKAEELIRRSVHPSDDVDARDLLNVELRWSSTVHLSALARYLRIKAEAEEFDTMYAYSRAALLNYAKWMLQHERRYLEHRDQLEFPTETWAAQDFRKANVLRLASGYADEPLRSQMFDRGNELARQAWGDLTQFESQHTARAVAIVMTEGTIDQFCRLCGNVQLALPPIKDLEFGSPTCFVTQKQRVKNLMRSPLRFLSALARNLWFGRSRIRC